MKFRLIFQFFYNPKVFWKKLFNYVKMGPKVPHWTQFLLLTWLGTSNWIFTIPNLHILLGVFYLPSHHLYKEIVYTSSFNHNTSDFKTHVKWLLNIFYVFFNFNAGFLRNDILKCRSSIWTLYLAKMCQKWPLDTVHFKI